MPQTGITYHSPTRPKKLAAQLTKSTPTAAVLSWQQSKTKGTGPPTARHEQQPQDNRDLTSKGILEDPNSTHRTSIP